MTVHVSEVTSEVSGPAGVADSMAEDPWEEQLRIAAAMDQVEHDRRRTATGYGDD